MRGILVKAGMAVIYGILIGAIVESCVSSLMKETCHGKGKKLIEGRGYRWLCLLGGGVVCYCYPVFGVSGMIFCVADGALLFAALMDFESSQVYRFVWWICAGAGIMLLCCRCGALAAEGRLFTGLAEWGGFCLLQQGFFSRKYGRADCHAFCCCSLLFCAEGGRLSLYFLHMLLSLGLLGMHQGFCHNIDARGNLKKPVPFVPYIGVAFLALWVGKCAAGLLTFSGNGDIVMQI
ncbi:MAG: hypothetical protein NC081_04225 [Roseburia sp.]|nr:hypothetical protein [Roseburia sp.]